MDRIDALNLVEAKKNELKSAFACYVDSQFATLRNSILDQTQTVSSQIDLQKIWNELEFLHENIISTFRFPNNIEQQQPSNSTTFFPPSNDNQFNTTSFEQNENILSPPVTPPHFNSIMTQDLENQDEFDDDHDEDVDEEQLEKHIMNCEDCVKRILDSIRGNCNNLENLIREIDATSYDTEKTKENGNEHFETQNNIDPSLESNQSIILNDQEIISNQINTINDNESIENVNSQLNTTTESDVQSSEQNNSIKITKRKRTKVQENRVKKAKSSNIDDQDEESDRIATECTTNPIQLNRHWQCSHCHKSFDRKSYFKRHLRVHTGERPFQCEKCGKRFSYIGNLERHKLIHQNIKPFQCVECYKRFKDKSNLAQHQLIHQNIKRFRCNECDRKFTQKRNLDSHLRIHSGERPFACRHCEMSFISSDNRNTHEQATHLHVKPYRCKQCGHTATQRAHIIKHIRVVHLSLPPTIKQQRALNIIDDRDPRELMEKV